MDKPHHLKAMHHDTASMYLRWRRAGFPETDMPPELTCLACTAALDAAYSQESMLDYLDDMIAQIQSYKERTATDWVYLERLKENSRQAAERVPNDDYRSELFPSSSR